MWLGGKNANPPKKKHAPNVGARQGKPKVTKTLVGLLWGGLWRVGKQRRVVWDGGHGEI